MHIGKDVIYTAKSSSTNNRAIFCLKTKALNYITLRSNNERSNNERSNNDGICIYSHIIGQPILYLYIYPKE